MGAPFLALTLVFAACGGDEAVPATTQPPTTTTTTTTTTTSQPATTVPPSTSSSTTSPQSTTVGTCPAADPADESAEWASFGFDESVGRHNTAEATLGVDTVPCLVEAWSIHELGGVTGTPIVVDGVAYFGDWDGRLHAVQADTGDIVWQHEISELAFTSTVIVTTDRIFVGDADGVLFARTRTGGDPVWSTELDAHPDAAIVASPVLVDGLLVAGVGGQSPWAAMKGSVVGVDAATGEIMWRLPIADTDTVAGSGVWTSAAVDRNLGMAYFGTGNSMDEPANPLSDSLIAIDYESGELVWSVALNPEHVGKADIGATPNLFEIDGRPVVGVGGKIGRYLVADRATGAVVWSVELTVGGDCCGVYTTAAIGEGAIYVSSIEQPGNTSITFALDATDGSIIWEQPMDGAAYGALTLANGVLYQGLVPGEVFALDAATGQILWSDQLQAAYGDGLAVVGGTVFVGYGFSPMLMPGLRGGVVAYRLP